METQRILEQPADHAAGIAVREESRGLVIRILTGITARNATETRTAVLSAWQDHPMPPKLILDLEEVNRIDSAGLGTLVDLAHRARTAGIPFILCGLQRAPMRLVSRTGLIGQFQISQSVDEALRRPSIGAAAEPPASADKVRKPVRARSHGLLWLAIAFVLVILAAGGVYGYWALETYRGRSNLLPAMQHQLAGAGQRIDAAETSLLSWRNQREDWERRLTRVEAKLDGTLQAARKEAGDIAAGAQRDMQAMLDKRTEALQSQVGAVQSAQQAQDARVAGLQEQLDQMKAANGQNGQDVSQLRDEMQQRHSAESNDIAALDRRVSSASQRAAEQDRDLTAVHNQLDRERVDFELGVNRERELAPGITLNLDHIDSTHQNFNGHVWLMPDRRTLWIHGQGLEQPLVFYSESDDRPRELVITRVTRSGVAGYLLLPRDAGATGAPTGPDSSTSTRN